MTKSLEKLLLIAITAVSLAVPIHVYAAKGSGGGGSGGGGSTPPPTTGADCDRDDRDSVDRAGCERIERAVSKFARIERRHRGI